MIAFGYGGLTSFSALFADDLHITPRSVFLSSMAASMLVGRLTIGRALDRIGHRKVLLPVLVMPAIGLLLLGFTYGPVMFVTSGVVFGAGFGLMYPAFAAYVMHARPGRAPRRGVRRDHRGVRHGPRHGLDGDGHADSGVRVSTGVFRRRRAGRAAVPYFLVAERFVWGRQKD